MYEVRMLEARNKKNKKDFSRYEMRSINLYIGKNDDGIDFVSLSLL